MTSNDQHHSSISKKSLATGGAETMSSLSFKTQLFTSEVFFVCVNTIKIGIKKSMIQNKVGVSLRQVQKLVCFIQNCKQIPFNVFCLSHPEPLNQSTKSEDHTSKLQQKMFENHVSIRISGKF